MTPRRSPAAVLRDIAADLRRLRPNFSHPDRYFEDRSEIEDRLRRLARELEE